RSRQHPASAAMPERQVRTGCHANLRRDCPRDVLILRLGVAALSAHPGPAAELASARVPGQQGGPLLLSSVPGSLVTKRADRKGPCWRPPRVLAFVLTLGCPGEPGSLI